MIGHANTHTLKTNSPTRKKHYRKSSKSTRLGDLLLGELSLLLDLADVDVADLGLVAVDDLGQLLESGALGLDVHEEDEDELEEDPAL